MLSIFSWLDSHAWAWPLFIFTARIMDVPLGTIRTICIVRGYRLISALLGFCEVTIWITAVSAVFRHLDQWINIVAYGAGFAAGNFIGIVIEERLALGDQVIRIISGSPHLETVVTKLRAFGHRVTEVAANNGSEAVRLFFMVVHRRQTQAAVELALAADPHVTLTVEDARYTNLPINAHPINWKGLLKRK